MSSSSQQLFSLNTIQVIAIALMATVLGSFISIPLVELFSAALVVAYLIKCRSFSIYLPKSGLGLLQIILGMSAGANVSFNELLKTIHPVLLVGLVACVFVQTSTNYFWLHRRERWSSFESILGAVPGAMAAILVISEGQAKPSAKVVYSHTIRILLLVVLAGIISSSHGGRASMIFNISWESLIAVIMVAVTTVVFGVVSGRLGLRAPFMVSALVVTALYNGTIDYAPIVIPFSAVNFALALLGVMIGSRLASTTLREAFSYAKAGLVVTLIGLGISVIFALIWSEFVNLNWLILLLAWVPGSVEAMTAVALLLGLEPAFVMVNHSIRILLLYCLPVIFKTRLDQLQRQHN